MSRLVIIGAGGQGKVACDIARKNAQYKDIVFLDDNVQGSVLGCPVVGKVCDINEFSLDSVFFIALGNPSIRKKIFNQLNSLSLEIVSLIHPQSIVGVDSEIGKGVLIAAGAVVGVSAKIGKGVIINTCASVDHDCEIGDFSHVAVGAHLAGTVKIGENVVIGVGVNVRNNLTICDDCIIGAGATVVSNISQSGTYIGIPAKRI